MGGANKQKTQVGLTENAFSVSGGSKFADIPMKSCFLPDKCVESSINFGISRIVIPNKCCNSDFCNVAIAPGNIYTFKCLKVDFDINGQLPQEKIIMAEGKYIMLPLLQSRASPFPMGKNVITAVVQRALQP